MWKTLVMGWDEPLFLERTACGEPFDQPDRKVWEVITRDGEFLGSLTSRSTDFRTILAGARDRILALVAGPLGVLQTEVYELEAEGRLDPES